MLFSGSVVKSGEANTLVVLTGNKTYFGKTIELVSFARPRLHTEEVISQIVTWLLVIVGISLAVAFVVSALAGINLLHVVPLALVLLASSIPVALPAMFTISMAIGSMDLVKRGVLVTRLSALEDAATMDTLCTDKTGTITMNKLSVAGIIPMNGHGENDVLKVRCPGLPGSKPRPDRSCVYFCGSRSQRFDGRFHPEVIYPLRSENEKDRNGRRRKGRKNLQGCKRSRSHCRGSRRGRCECAQCADLRICVEGVQDTGCCNGRRREILKDCRACRTGTTSHDQMQKNCWASSGISGYLSRCLPAMPSR